MCAGASVLFLFFFFLLLCLLLGLELQQFLKEELITLFLW